MFDGPPVCAESLVGFDASAGDAWGDPPVCEEPSGLDGVVGLVCVEFVWAGPAWSASRADRGDGADERGQRGDIGGVRREDGSGQRESVAVG